MATSHGSVKCICSDKKVVEVDPKTWKSKCGTFQCLKDILDVLKSDMFFEGVDVSFSSLKLIAKNVSTKSQALQLVCVFADRLKLTLDPKRRSIVEKMVEEIADGFEVNKCFDQDEIFEFIYELLDNGINNRSAFPGDNATIISGFALEVLHKRTEKGEPFNLELIDPFLPLVMGCLSNQPILSSALRGLKSLLRFPLPSLREEEEGDGSESLGYRLASDLAYVVAPGVVASGMRKKVSLENSLSCFDILKWHISKDLTMKMSSRLFAALLPSIPRDAEPFKAPSQAGALIGHMIENIDGGTVGLLIHKCLALFEKHPAAIAEVLIFFMKPLEKKFRKHVKTILLAVEVAHTSDERFYSLVMVFRTLQRFPHYHVLDKDFEMRVVFSVYEEFSKKEECHLYAWEVMFPLCKVCEGFAGENISVELKELGDNVRDSLSSANQMFAEAYRGIRQGLQADVKKRAGEELELGKAARRRKIK